MDQVSVDSDDLFGRYMYVHLIVISQALSIQSAGKSTISKLLLRLYDPLAGGILVDSTPLTELNLKWWRSQVRKEIVEIRSELARLFMPRLQFISYLYTFKSFLTFYTHNLIYFYLHASSVR